MFNMYEIRERCPETNNGHQCFRPKYHEVYGASDFERECSFVNAPAKLVLDHVGRHRADD